MPLPTPEARLHVPPPHPSLPSLQTLLSREPQEQVATMWDVCVRRPAEYFNLLDQADSVPVEKRQPVLELLSSADMHTHIFRPASEQGAEMMPLTKQDIRSIITLEALGNGASDVQRAKLRAFQSYLGSPLAMLKDKKEPVDLGTFKDNLAAVYLPVSDFVTDLMERAQYGDESAGELLKGFSYWHDRQCVYRGVAASPIHVETVANYAANRADGSVREELACIASLPVVMRSFIDQCNVKKEKGIPPQSAVIKMQRKIASETRDSIRVLQQFVRGRPKQPEDQLPYDPLTLMELNFLETLAQNAGFYTAFGSESNPTVERMTYLAALSCTHKHNVALAVNPGSASKDIRLEALSLRKARHLFYYYEGEENRQLALQAAAQGVEEAAKNIGGPLSEKGVAACIRLSTGPLPEHSIVTAQRLHEAIAASTRSLHSRGHVCKLRASRDFLAKIGATSLTYVQHGLDFEASLVYRGSTLPVTIREDGEVIFPDDVLDPQAKQKIGLMITSHLAVLLGIKAAASPEREPKRAVATEPGDPVLRRVQHLQIQPAGKRCRQLGKNETNRHIAEWLGEGVTMELLNLGFMCAQAEQGFDPSDIGSVHTLPVLQDFSAAVRLKIAELLTRLYKRGERLGVPDEEGKFPVHEVSYVHERRVDQAGDGPIESSSLGAEEFYTEIIPETMRTSPSHAGTVFEASP